MKVQKKKYLKVVNKHRRLKERRTLGECLYSEFQLFKLDDVNNIQAKTGEHAMRCFENLVELVD